MSNPSGAKGSEYERSLLGLVQKYWPYAIRPGKQGVRDKGDFHMPGNDRYILEAKNEKRMNLSGWLKEAEVEAENAGVPYGVVVHKKRGTTAPEEQYATLRFGDFLKLVHGER